MIVVECPSCQRRYDPQCEDALDAVGDGSDASIKVVCPNCGQWLRLPEWEAVEAPGVPDDILMEMREQSKLLPEGDSDELTFGPGVVYEYKPKKPWWAFWR